MTENNESVKVEGKETQQWEKALETESSIAPYVDIYETVDNFVLTANMPGVSKENIKLKLKDGSLVIFGKINFEEAVNRNYILNESSIGNYYRQFRISDGVDESKISAKFENGQLEITLPKHDRIKPRTINIQ